MKTRGIIHRTKSLWLGIALLPWIPAASPAQSTRPGWGSTVYADASGTGVTFRVWAPHAATVSVAGTFNGWNASSSALVLEPGTSGVWSADVAGALPGQSYKFVINGTLWQTDPRSRQITPADNNNSVIVLPAAFAWQGDSFAVTNVRDLVIYEMHVGTFCDLLPNDGLPGTFGTFTNRLDYLRDLGVTAMELMPVNEFPSATSWGYNPAYPFAVETSYGTPDALRELVRLGHRKGLATLIDVVHNHWDGNSSLWHFDGWAPDPAYGGLYFYNTAPNGFSPWGPRPDYSRAEVQSYINDTFRMWLDEYHIDGFRWDAPQHILYATNGAFIADGQAMVTNALAMMASNYPNAWNAAEDLKEITAFDSYWDLAFHGDLRSVLTQGDDANRDMPTVARNIAGPAQRVIFTESHDTTGDLNGGSRLPTAIHGADPAGYYARKRSTLGAGLVMTSPGIPMIFQGQDMLETNQFSDTRPVDWTRTNTFLGINRLYRDLIHLRRNLDGLSGGLMGDGCSTYQVDNGNKLVAFSRWVSGTTGQSVVVVAHFANTTRTSFPIQFPDAGSWYVHFNSDSTNYSSDYANFGSVEVQAAGSPPTGLVDIAPYSLLILSQTPRSGMLIQKTVAVDAPAGNANSLLDPGEVVKEQITLWNKSQVAATNIAAELSCDTPGVTMRQSFSVYPSMPPDGAATNLVGFEYTLASGLACGSVLSFRLATSFNGQTHTDVFSHVVGQLMVQPPATNVFASLDVPKVIVDTSTTYSVLSIALPGTNTIRDINVQLRINHTFDRDLTLALQHPDGTEVVLATRRGSSGDNYGTGACGAGTNTTFDQGAAQSISNASPPFATVYRPEGNLGLLNGKSINGDWRLRMKDSGRTDTGTNLCWSIRAIYEQSSYGCSSFSNRPPIATPRNLTVTSAETTNITLSGTDPDGQSLAFQSVAAPAHGLLAALNTDTWQTAYTPVFGFAGTDTFAFAASDGLTSSAPALVTLVVPPPADADGDGLPDVWEQMHCGNATSCTNTADEDGDGLSNLEEYRSQTNPTNDQSVLRLLTLQETNGSIVVRWPAAGGSRYELDSSADLGWEFYAVTQALGSVIAPLPIGAPATLSFTDAIPVLPGVETNRFRAYRVRAVNW